MASHSSWRSEDLLDLERCGLAAELASTNLGPGGLGRGTQLGGPEIDLTYDMSEVLDNLMQDNSEFPLLLEEASMSLPANSSATSAGIEVGDAKRFEITLNAPTAYGIKTEQERVTYLNKGYSYEIQLQHSSATPLLYKGTLSLSFCELRWRNSEKEHFDQWSREHPCDRLLEIDVIGCDKLSNVSNDDSALNVIHFSWGQSKTAVLAIKLNCLSTEFAAKKHGGERGVPLRLVLAISEYNEERQREEVLYQGMCGIKVFKDKGGDRKQRQDQVKVEKLPVCEQIKFHSSSSTTQFSPLPLSPNNSTANLPSTPFKSDSTAVSLTPGSSPFNLTTPPCQLLPSPSHTTNIIISCTSVEETRKWLMVNRFDLYSSLFSNYTGTDLVRLSRRDLMELCGHADGIRLYNALRCCTLKTLYIRLVQEEDKVFQAVCLESLTAQELLLKLLEKLGGQSVGRVSSFVRLTSSGLLVMVDDTMVHSIQDEACFLVQTVKEEDGSLQVVLRDHTPPNHKLELGLSGRTPRH